MAIAIVLAGGMGKRMNSEIPKQFMLIGEKEILSYSLEAFEANPNVSEIILVTRQEDIEYCKKNIKDKYGFKKITKICTGGAERYNSVFNGLKEIHDDNQIVIIHDGARPFIDSSLIDTSIEAAEKYGACTLGVKTKDTIKIVDENNFGKETPRRDYLYNIQTPQTFNVGVIKKAYAKMFENENHNITDDSMLVEQYGGVKTKVIEGSYYNIKITTPEDVEFAKILVKNKIKKN